MKLTPESTTAVAAPERINLTVVREAPRSATPAVTTPLAGRFPAWLRAIDAVHRADRSPLPFASDFAVAAGCATIAGVSWWVAALLASGLVCLLYMSGAYADRDSVETQGVLWFAARSLTAVAFSALVGVAIAQFGTWDVGAALRFGWSAALGLLVVRALTWMVLAAARRRGLGLRRTLIVGHSSQASTLAGKLVEYPEGGLLPVAMLPLGNGHGFARFMPEFPNAFQLAHTIEDAGIEHVVLAPDGSDQAILECVKSSDGLDVTFSILPPLAEFFLNPAHVAQVGGIPLIPLGRIAKRRTAQPGKRIFDIGAASVLLALLSPVMIATALAIKVSDRRSILYRQRRVGRDGVVFELLKFRSMVEDAERIVIDLREHNATDGLLFKVVDDPRVTKVGKIIRRLSVDELPQLWNVIRGEMSLVGPRPLAVLPEDFGPIDGRRHTVTPGITGYWQISGGNGLRYEEMIKLDLAYVQNWSLWLDIRLLCRTVPALLHRRGPW